MSPCGSSSTVTDLGQPRRLVEYPECINLPLPFVQLLEIKNMLILLLMIFGSTRKHFKRVTNSELPLVFFPTTHFLLCPLIRIPFRNTSSHTQMDSRRRGAQKRPAQSEGLRARCCAQFCAQLWRPL